MSETPAPCWRCGTTGAAGVCCSSHGKELCHRCYRLTHFVEVCGCFQCATESLPRVLTGKVIAAEVSPVETLRAAAARLRTEPSAPWWWSGLVHPGLAVPLAEWLEREAAYLEENVQVWTFPTMTDGCQVNIPEAVERNYGEALAVARVLLGVPGE